MMQGMVAMADYYSLISRVVAALETNTFEARRAIYNYARAAQSEQLHNRPFNKKDFDRERLMLEDAVSRVEIEVTGGRIATGPSPGTRVRPSNIATSLPPVDEDKTRKGATVIAQAIRKTYKCLTKMFAPGTEIPRLATRNLAGPLPARKRICRAMRLCGEASSDKRLSRHRGQGGRGRHIQADEKHLYL